LMSTVALRDVVMAIGFAQHYLSLSDLQINADKPCKPCTRGKRARLARFLGVQSH
jgi:hypothetical protein